jgi:hypothetical protein
MTCDGYVDGEWYAHQGLQVTEWPPLENCLTIDAEACNELRAVFHMLGEAVPNAEEIVRASLEKDMAKTALDVERDVVMKLIGEQKPWPFPTGKAPEKQPEPEKPAPELLAKIDAWVARQPESANPTTMPPPGMRFTESHTGAMAPVDGFVQIDGQPYVARHVAAVFGARFRDWQAQQASATQPTEPHRIEVELRGGGMPPDRRATVAPGSTYFAAVSKRRGHGGGWDRHVYTDSGQKTQDGCAIWTSEPQVRSRSAAAKSPLNGLLTEQSGRYCGLGYCDEETA